MTLKICLIGDVFGEAGIIALQENLSSIIKEHAVDFVIANAENASGGYGLLESDAEKILASGVNVLTGGNHTFEKKEIYAYLDAKDEILRPENYSTAGATVFNEFVQKDLSAEEGVHGSGFKFFETPKGSIAVLNIQGRKHMTAIDCPFMCAHHAALTANEKNAALVIDFHAESNDEKEALAYFLDGRATLVCGTHTHVQTSDERILPKGTGYITDLGLTGVQKSVIGSVIESSIRRNLTQVLYKLENAQGEACIQGIIAEIDMETKKTLSIKRISCR
ncbi:MAG: TIGR00282 family metallophosphoesterase [Treponemataceae bacterium]